MLYIFTFIQRVHSVTLHYTILRCISLRFVTLHTQPCYIDNRALGVQVPELYIYMRREKEGDTHLQDKGACAIMGLFREKRHRKKATAAFRPHRWHV